MSTIKETFQQAIKSQIGNNKDHGWGVDDSVNVIDQLLAEFCEQIAQDKGANEELLSCIKSVINPSQFRQILEMKGLLSTTPNKRKQSATKLLLDGLV